MWTAKGQLSLHIHAVKLGPSLSAKGFIGYNRMYVWRSGWYFAHGQDDMNLGILHMFKGTFSLDVAQLMYTFYQNVLANSKGPDKTA